MNNKKWDTKFLKLAKTIASFSKDPSTKVGAVIANNDNKVISIGYNGFPRGIKDDARLNDRNLKYEIIVHAEANAILFADTPLRACTAYTWPFQPCSRCASLIVQSGVRRVVSIQNIDKRWNRNFKLAEDIFKEAGVVLQIY